jgi:hypothetical protein
MWIYYKELHCILILWPAQRNEATKTHQMTHYFLSYVLQCSINFGGLRCHVLLNATPSCSDGRY